VTTVYVGGIFLHKMNGPLSLKLVALISLLLDVVTCLATDTCMTTDYNNTTCR